MSKIPAPGVQWARFLNHREIDNKGTNYKIPLGFKMAPGHVYKVQVAVSMMPCDEQMNTSYVVSGWNNYGM